MGTVTKVLNQSSLSEALNDSKLQGLLYQELKVIAHGKLNRHAGNEVNTTSLVHEAFIKLNNHDSKDKQWANRKHFYATAALAMRQILLDQARHKLAIKRDAEAQKVTFNEHEIHDDQGCNEIIALSGALDDMEKIDSQMVELVHLKYFVGLPVTEIADIFKVSKKTIDREWNKAKSLLKVLMGV